MNREQILSDLNSIFREAFDDENLVIEEKTAASDVEDWDSLMQITLVTEIEKKYNVQFNIKDVIELKNVGDMIDLIIRSHSK